MVLSRVDLPAPLGPMRPISCALSAVRLTPFSKRAAPTWHETSSAAITGGLWVYILIYSGTLKEVVVGSGNRSGHRTRASSSAPSMFQCDSVVKCLLSTT